MSVIRYVLLCAIAVLPLKAALPDSVATKAREVGKLFAEVTHPAYRVHLMVLPSNIPVAPPLQANEFERAAKVILTIESGAAFDLIHQVLDVIEESSWKKAVTPGYAGSYWQLRGPSGVLIDFLIDEVGRMVSHDGTWYSVDAKLLSTLTTDTISIGSELLAKRRTPDWKP